jgi:NDP-sugar pyrophosphorylase family protein
MSQFNIPVAVILPVDIRILGVDIGGEVAHYNLLKMLHENNQDHLMVISSNEQLDQYKVLFSKFSKIKVLTLNEIDLSKLNNMGVLFIDARAWLSQKDLKFIFSNIREFKSGFKFYESVKHIFQGYRKPMPIAIYRPPQKLVSQIFLEEKLSIDSGLDEIINHASLPHMLDIYSGELDSLHFSILVTSFVDVAEVERHLYLHRAIVAMQKGVRINDPYTVYIRGNLVCDSEVEINANVILEGNIFLGSRVKIYSNSILKDCQIGKGTVINPFSLIEHSSVGLDSFIGPYGRIRPGCVIGNNVQIGNYVEIKNSQIGDGTRINHHTFIGDSLLADHVTIGAGTITCNHDGIGINRTVIERGAYIGSGCNLVAPLNIGAGATIGAGSTITQDVPAEKLTLARSIQITIHDWVRP